MQIIVPTTLTLVSSTATASPYDEWDIATAYVTGDRVTVSTAAPHLVYEALQASTAKVPADEPTYWALVGVTNPYKLIDDRTSTATTGTTEFETVVTFAERASHFGVFGLSNVTQVRFELEHDGATVIDETYEMTVFDPAASYSDYFFGTSYLQGSLIVLIPGYYFGGTVTLTLTGETGATIGCGHFFIGLGTYLGRTIQPYEDGAIDYSRKEPDEWGEVQLVERSYRERITAQFVARPERRDVVKRVLNVNRATPCAYDLNDDGSDWDGLRLFGFWRDYTLRLDEDIVADIELESLT